MKLAFETIDVEVRMMGRTGTEQVFNTFERKNVTPPEFMILQELHGPHNIVITSAQKEIAKNQDGIDEKGKKTFRIRSEDEEIDRLRSWYGINVFAAVFPQKSPRLPYTFEAAGIYTSVPDNVTTMSSKRSVSKNTKKLVNTIKTARQDDEGDDSDEIDDDLGDDDGHSDEASNA